MLKITSANLWNNWPVNQLTCKLTNPLFSTFWATNMLFCTYHFTQHACWVTWHVISDEPNCMLSYMLFLDEPTLTLWTRSSEGNGNWTLSSLRSNIMGCWRFQRSENQRSEKSTYMNTLNRLLKMLYVAMYVDNSSFHLFF